MSSSMSRWATARTSTSRNQAKAIETKNFVQVGLVGRREVRAPGRPSTPPAITLTLMRRTTPAMRSRRRRREQSHRDHGDDDAGRQTRRPAVHVDRRIGTMCCQRAAGQLAREKYRCGFRQPEQCQAEVPSYGQTFVFALARVLGARPYDVRVAEHRSAFATNGRSVAKLDDGVPKGIRTPVTAVKGRCPRPLDDGDAESKLRIGGARRDRTVDLLHAMQALSQLSYGPTRGAASYGSVSGMSSKQKRLHHIARVLTGIVPVHLISRSRVPLCLPLVTR